MKRDKKLLLIIIPFLLILTGCWDKNELNELSIATGAAIDKAENGYMVSVQTVNSGEVTSQVNSAGTAPVMVRTKSGETLYSAIRELSTTNSKRLYGSHLQLLIISEEVAKEGIADILDYLSRDNDFRADFFIVIAKESKARDILKMQTISSKIPTNALTKALKVSEKVWGGTVTISFKELLNILTIPGRSPVIPMMDLEGDLAIGPTKANTESTTPPVTYHHLGSGVFHKDQLIGSLNKQEVKSFNYIRDEIKHAIEVLECSSGEMMAIEILHSKTKKHVINERNSPSIEINIKTEANVGEMNCSIDLTNPDELLKLEKLVEEKISQDLHHVIEKVQTDYQTDIFGFGEIIYRSHPAIWHELSPEWSEHFADLDVQINVTVTLSQIGSTKNSFKQDIKE